jgi:RND superfamily putative drug exporter
MLRSRAENGSNNGKGARNVSTSHSGALARLARACALHPWRTIGIWIAVIVGISFSASAFGGKLVNEFKIPGSETQQATDLLESRFPARAGDSAQVVFQTDGKMTDASAREDVAAAQAAAKKVHGVLEVGDPYAQRAGAVSKDGKIAYFDVQYSTPAAEVEETDIDALQDDVREAVGESSLRLEFGGPVINSVSPESKTSEMLGLAAAMIVLLLVLGTAVAMSVPIAVALISCGLGLSLLTIGAAFSDFNTITPILAVMIGLGVGIDYALFIVTRFRQALADGAKAADAATAAVATAGRAVIFAGATVAISISGLALVGIPFVTKLGLGAAMTVICAVFTAVTLLPAVLSKLGHKIGAGRVPFVKQTNSTADLESGAFAKWGRFVTSHPKSMIAVTLAAIATMAIPFGDIRLGTADAGTNPSSTTTRKAYDMLAEGFGPGFNGPLLVAVDQKDAPGTAGKLAKAFRETPGVATVPAPVVNETGDTAQVAVILKTSPQSVETSDKLKELRSTVVPETLAGMTAHAYIGGTTASYEDIATKLGDKMPIFLLYIVGITFLVLTMAFRSIVIAAKAALTTLLSGVAAFGALVAVFQWGWMGGLVGLDVTGPTESFIPVIVLSILFGLSMDYEVFLASRIREAYVRGVDPRAAVREGVGSVGKVIVAAAIIMGVVFWAFVLGDSRSVKAFGVGLGVAILVDALIVRMTLVPAIMHLLGKRAWYIPRWLDKVLPNLTIEPAEEPEHVEQDEEDERELDLPKAA